MQEFLEIIFWGNSVKAYLVFVLALMLGLLFKNYFVRILSKIIFLVLGRFKSGAKINELISYIKKPVDYIVFLLIIYAGFVFLKAPVELVDNPFYTKMITGLYYFYKILMILLITWFIAKIFDFIAHGALQRAEDKEDKQLSQAIPFLRDLVKISLYLLFLVFILGAVFKFNVAAIITGLGIGGLALALAAQETLANLLASFTIFLDKPFIVGDFIQSGDVIGVVEHVGLRSTRIRTLEKSYLTLPNKMLVEAKVDNMTLRTFRRVRFTISIVYNTPPETIKAIVSDIQNLINEHPNTNQEGIVRFYEFGNSSLDLLLNYFIDTMDWPTYLSVREEINLNIIEIVKKHGSDFAYPTQTLHLQKENKK